MYEFKLTEQYLTKEEEAIFDRYLDHYGLDRGIWEVFASLFRSGLKHTQPMLLKIYSGTELTGVIILVKCSKYGKALFKNRLAAGIINLFPLPYYQWIRFGCCMDMMSNPGFVKDPGQTGEVLGAAVRYLSEKKLLTIVTDHTSNAYLFEGASQLPALPHALIECTRLSDISEYLRVHKNLKRKLRVFEIKGGEFITAVRSLNNEQIERLKQCFISTASNSVFYLPYQELYLNAALTTSHTLIDQTVYFIAMLNGTFIGYQAALKTGRHLNALHGAFDRSLRTTYHAYDILFVKMTEYALKNDVESIDFGAVLNQTKQKMVNHTVGMSYFLMSRYSLLQRFFYRFLKITSIQGEDQLKFLDNNQTEPV